jgi:pseudaminic acid synthase
MDVPVSTDTAPPRREGRSNIGAPWDGRQTWIIAEISCNHQGSLHQALELIDAAAHAGADAVKFQCFDLDEMTLPSAESAFRLPSGPWAGRTLWDLYAEAQTPWDWFPELWGAAELAGILPFASIFGRESLGYIVALGSKALKVASPEAADMQFLARVRDTGLPTIISLGVASSQAIPPWGPDLAVLHCVSSYPTPYAAANLRAIPALLQRWPVVGFSDHTVGELAACSAVALGARIIEKHLMLEGTTPLDASFSLTPAQFGRMVRAIRTTEAMLMASEAPEPLIQRRWIPGATRPLRAIQGVPATLPRPCDRQFA